MSLSLLHNINELIELGYKPARMVDIWTRASLGRCTCMPCNICEMPININRLMAKTGKIKFDSMRCGGMPECYILVDALQYPGYIEFKQWSHNQRASIAIPVCYNCWETNSTTLVNPANIKANSTGVDLAAYISGWLGRQNMCTFYDPAHNKFCMRPCGRDNKNMLGLCSMHCQLNLSV